MLSRFGVCSLLLASCLASPLPKSQAKVTLSAISQRAIFGASVGGASSPDGSLLQSDDGIAKRTMSSASLDGANFPDPAIIQDSDGTWYSFATRTIGTGVHIQAAKSSDYSTWEILLKADGTPYDALPNLPAWINQGSPNTWAPDVVQVADGSFVMYFSATAAANGRFHCVGAATSPTILGPYTALTEPMFCPLDQGGAIDASGFEDAGQRYVVYKVDGNSMGHGGPCGNTVAPFVGTPLKLQPVAANGVTFQGDAITLLDNAGASDQGIVEAPALMKSGSTFVLFFSSNCYADGHYTLSYATSPFIAGPYTRAAAPLLQTGDGFTSPGGADIHTDGEHVVFHAASPAGTGRALYQATISVSEGVVSY